MGNERLRKELLGAEQDAVRTQAETAARQRGESIAATERAGDEAASEIEDEGPEDEDRLEAAAALLDEHQVDSSLWLVRRTSELRWENAAPVRIGARMARPEKAAHREMKPAVHALFPIATEGGPQRLLSAAAERGSLRVQLGVRPAGCSKGSLLETRMGRHNNPSQSKLDNPRTHNSMIYH